MTDFSTIPWIKDHIDLYRTDPAKAHNWDSTPLGGPGILPTLLLTTIGRKSGEPRSLPLIYGKTADSVVIVASKGGLPTHPQWFLNLTANANCEVQVSTEHMYATARVAEGTERAALWQMMAEIYPPYNEYQALAKDRMIPVVVLDRA